MLPSGGLELLSLKETFQTTMYLTYSHLSETTLEGPLPEKEKTPTKKKKEEEIGNLPDKGFLIMIVKMIQNLEINGITDKQPGEKD